jgi:hypothetical protein
MQRTIAIVMTFLCCTGSGLVIGQVYETHDAEGNLVFSDTPSPEAQEVAVPQTNISKPTASSADNESPPETPEAGRPAQENVRGENVEKSNIVIIGDEEAKRTNEYIDNEGRREVRDAEKRDEVLEAEPRHEVR